MPIEYCVSLHVCTHIAWWAPCSRFVLAACKPALTAKTPEMQRVTRVTQLLWRCCCVCLLLLGCDVIGASAALSKRQSVERLLSRLHSSTLPDVAAQESQLPSPADPQLMANFERESASAQFDLASSSNSYSGEVLVETSAPPVGPARMTVPLKNAADSLHYMFQLQAGTPGQLMNIILDLGSSDLVCSFPC
mgnify:CR=1 FL=1